MSLSPAAARWSDLVERHERSGLTLQAFADQHGVKKSTLAWWRCRLGKSKRSKKSVKTEVTTFVEVTVAEPDDAVVIGLDRYNAQVIVDADTDLGLLRRVLVALC